MSNKQRSPQRRAKQSTTPSRSLRCVTGNKKKYSYEEAKDCARTLRSQFHSTHHEYYCRRCGWFHVGSSTVIKRKSK